MWEIDINFQLLGFIDAVLFGMTLCGIYDIFKAFRLSFEFSKIAIFIQDIIYFIFISIISFVFLLIFTNGEIRLYILLGFAIGFIISRFTVSRILLPVLKTVILFFKRIFSFVFIKIGLIFVFTEKIFNIIIKFLKNIKNSAKKLLKTRKGLLYTKQE